MSTHLRIEHIGVCLSITIDRAEAGNRITMEMIEAITHAIRDMPRATKLLVLRASGDEFCLGRDYGAAPEDARQGERPTVLDIRDRMTSPILGLYSAIKDAPVPTLSVVQGQALGFGCALACSCDLVLAGERARFGLPEMRERGLPPTLAATALLDRLSLRALTYLVFSTETIDANEALRSGLVSAVCPEHELAERADALIATISVQPLESVRAVKEYFRIAPHAPPQARAPLGAGLFAMVAAST